MPPHRPIGLITANDHQTRHLVRLVVRLARALRVKAPRSNYPDEALDYLESSGLIDSQYRRTVSNLMMRPAEDIQ